MIVPAAAGSIPATVVRKNSRNVLTKEYVAESPKDAEAYPSFTAGVILFVCINLLSYY